MSKAGGDQKLRKDLSLFGVFAVATGTTLSAGFFLLPGLAFTQSGPAVILAYLIAALMMVAPMLCIVELATAMPKAGGTYFFLDRSLGPLAGTIGGLGTWLALTLKAAFALVGMGAYISLIVGDIPVELIAVGLAIIFGVVNFMGAKATTRFQVVMVVGLLALLCWFMTQGVFSIDTSRFDRFFDKGSDAIIATAGLVFISYVGVTNVASVAEEIKDPERNLPRGVFMALGTAVAIYIVGLIVMVGVIPPAKFADSYTPVGIAALEFAGTGGLVLIAIAALFAFMSVANAGIMSSSRYPMAMSRDHLLPGIFRGLNRHGAPTVSLVVTVGAIIFYVLAFDVLEIAKLASAFQLSMFALLSLAVIVMRESNIDSYDPSYKVPWYPWIPLAGIFGSCWLITEMGTLPSLFAVGLVIVGVVWFFAYANKRIDRSGAIYHVFERLGQRRFEGLDSELRGILKERGLRASDPFDEIIATSEVIDARKESTFESVTLQASDRLARVVQVPAATLARNFLEGTRLGATPVSRGVALPHVRFPEIEQSHLVIVRSRMGLEIEVGHADFTRTSSSKVHAILFLLSSDEDPASHLRLLAQLAACFEQEGFMDDWLAARSHDQIREVLLRDERYLTLVLDPGVPEESLIGVKVRELRFPSGCLIAIIRRGTKTLIPKADMVLEPGDRLTVIGEREGIKELRDRFSTSVSGDASEA